MSDAPAPIETSNPGKWQRPMIRTIGLAIIRTIYRIRTIHPERIPRSGGVLLLPNHVTFADAFFITAACRRPVRFVMDEAFMAFKPVRWFCTIFNTVTIRKDQPREALKITIDALKNGDLVCFFPEGQLSRTGSLNELRRGVELIARKADAPLVPMWNDGAWGSVFSFERGRFFKKLPYRLPHFMTSAFGETIAPAEATLESIRTGLLKAAAEALDRKFPERSFIEINGYQIGQVAALPWRRPFSALQGDPLVNELPALFQGFSEEFGSLAGLRKELSGPLKSWVGGGSLRAAIEGRDSGLEIDFYDFSPGALEPLVKPGLRHFPCLAIKGRVISLSMPDPARPTRGAEEQLGSKPGTWGKLLPGWFIEAGRVKGPAAPPEGLPLPAGAFLDPQGFIAAG